MQNDVTSGNILYKVFIHKYENTNVYYVHKTQYSWTNK